MYKIYVYSIINAACLNDMQTICYSVYLCVCVYVCSIYKKADGGECVCCVCVLLLLLVPLAAAIVAQVKCVKNAAADCHYICLCVCVDWKATG